MKGVINVKPDKIRLTHILEEIKKGSIKIPIFQREFLWTGINILALFDSIEKSYPIGSLLFWKPEEEYRYKEEFGQYIVSNKTKEIKYVLDGSQRLSTLFGCLANPKNFSKVTISETLKKCEVYYDLDREEFSYFSGKQKQPYLIPLYVLIDTFELLDFCDELRTSLQNKELSDKYIQRARKIATTFVDYEIPYIDIKGGDIKGAVDIFSRVNSTGIDLSKDWMLSALSHNDEFLLSDKIDNLLKELELYNFEKIDRDIILHCIETSTGKIYFDVKTEKIANSKNFPKIVEDTFTNIKLAIEFLRNNFHIIDYKLLPYNTQLIFLTEFFRLNKNPNETEISELQKWFWITTYSNYFTIYSLSKQRTAFQYFQEFALRKRKEAIYNHDDQQLFTTYPFVDKINFGSVRSKALMLFLLNRAYENTKYIEYTPLLEIRYLFNGEKNFSSVVLLQSNDDRRIPTEFIHKKSNADFLLNENRSELFISEYNDNMAMNNYLINRLMEIKKAEKEFVIKIGLNYYEEDEKGIRRLWILEKNLLKH